MAASADHYYFPSREEIGVMQSEIIALENEVMGVQKVIEQAQLQIDELTQQLNERKSRIAPVRMAGFDILSSIFERCSEIDWKSPLTIMAVSHRWREVVLHTPRAWCFIDISSLDETGIHAYFERSGQCDLHVALDFPDEVGQLTPVAHRVQCIVIPFPPGSLGDLTFPRLTRLRSPLVRNAYQPNDPAVITPSRFPNLRHLELRNILLDVDNCGELLFLQTLKITYLGDGGWAGLLRACRGSLVSLQITCPAGDYISEVPQVELPKLRYLKIGDEDQEDCSWASPLVAPALQVYWEESVWHTTREPRQFSQSIAYLRLERVPVVFPTQLRVLQLDLSILRFHSLITDLENDPSLFPHLEILEFGQSYVVKFEVAEMEKLLDGCDWQTRPRLLRPPSITAKWSISLPDEIDVECGKSMPCALW